MDLNLTIKSEKPIIYLAGHTKENEYRKYCIEKYGKSFKLIDPLEKVNKIIENDNSLSKKEIAFKICKSDKVLILNSDCLVAYFKKPTVGTIMEIFFAFTMDIETYIIMENKQYENDYWLLAHSHKIFSNTDNCFNYLKIKYNKRDI